MKKTGHLTWLIFFKKVCNGRFYTSVTYYFFMNLIMGGYPAMDFHFTIEDRETFSLTHTHTQAIEVVAAVTNQIPPT